VVTDVTVCGGGAATADEVVKDGSRVVEGAAVVGSGCRGLLLTISTMTTTSTITVTLATMAATVTGHGMDPESAASVGAGSSLESCSGKASNTGGGESLAL
jgi:hypothetical protein